MTEYGTFPTYSFIFGNEACYWCDAPGGDLSENFIYTGMWNGVFNGYWVNYPGEVAGTVQMEPYT